MTTRIIIVTLILSACFTARAQVEEIAQQLAENEYRKFAVELPNAFIKGKDELFGNARALKEQFFLEEDAKAFADFLGWDRRQFSQKSLGKVFKALSDKSKPGKNNPNPLSVTFDIPSSPTESIVTVIQNKRGTPQKRETVVNYVVTTKTNVTVETTKNGVNTSIVNNDIVLIWDGRVNLINGEVDGRRRTAPPILRTIVINPDAAAVSAEPAKPAESTQLKEEQMRARAKELIEEYYRNLRSSNFSAVLAPEIPNKAEFETWLRTNTRIETDGTLYVPQPMSISQSIEVSNVPGIKIYVNEGYYQLAPVFLIDFQADKITKVVYAYNFVRPELEPRQVVQEPPVRQTGVQPTGLQSVPAPSGEHYKVQILLLQTFVPRTELPEKFRVDNLDVERYPDGYKYVVSANSLNEAFAIKNRMISRGIEDAWIVVYRNGERIRPPQGFPNR